MRELISDKNSLRLAILDMNNGMANLGLASIENIVKLFPEYDYEIFDVRNKCEVPGTDFDVYICSGGPGSPIETGELWNRAFSNLIDRLWAHNGMFEDKKYVFFICHSFQMICNHFGLGDILPRKSMAFGVYPVHMTPDGTKEKLFKGLDDPFYAGDFRSWQFIQPNKSRIYAMGAKILAIEKERPHIPLERAIMAVRFSPYWFGTQFHPEAHSVGMVEYFSTDKKKVAVIAEHGEEKYLEILEEAQDPNKLDRTRKQLIPQFLENAIRHKKMIGVLA